MKFGVFIHLLDDSYQLSNSTQRPYSDLIFTAGWVEEEKFLIFFNSSWGVTDFYTQSLYTERHNSSNLHDFMSEKRSSKLADLYAIEAKCLINQKSRIEISSSSFKNWDFFGLMTGIQFKANNLAEVAPILQQLAKGIETITLGQALLAAREKALTLSKESLTIAPESSKEKDCEEKSSEPPILETKTSKIAEEISQAMPVKIIKGIFSGLAKLSSLGNLFSSNLDTSIHKTPSITIQTPLPKNETEPKIHFNQTLKTSLDWLDWQESKITGTSGKACSTTTSLSASLTNLTLANLSSEKHKLASISSTTPSASSLNKFSSFHTNTNAYNTPSRPKETLPIKLHKVTFAKNDSDDDDDKIPFHTQSPSVLSFATISTPSPSATIYPQSRFTTPNKKMVTHFENGIYEFRKKVLSWHINDLLNSNLAKLLEQNLAKVLPNRSSNYNGKARDEYFSSFKPLILEDARASLAQGLEEALDGTSKPFMLTVKKAKISKNPNTPSVLYLTGKSPDNEEYGNFVVLIHKPGSQIDDSSLLGLATYQKNERDDQPENASATTNYLEKKFEVKVILKDKELLQEDATGAIKIEAFVLGAIISHQRMYEVCTMMPKAPFESQIILGELPPPPNTEITLNPSEQQRLSTLNLFQQLAVKNFLALNEGVQLLQGPPGTGKTTTIVNMLEILYSQNTRTMVCAPSNKAVQVLATKFLRSNPNASIIFSGIENKLPPDNFLRQIFLYTWGYDLCKRIANLQDHIEKIYKIYNAQKDKSLTQRQLQVIFTNAENILSEINKTSPFLRAYYDLASFSKYVMTLIDNCQHKTTFVDATNSCTETPQNFTSSVSSNDTMCTNGSYSSSSSSNEQIFKITEEHENMILGKNDNEPQMLFKKMIDILNHLMLAIHKTQESGSLEEEILNNAKIIFTTLCSSGRQSVQNMNPVEVLIVDEAGQAVEAETLIPFRLMPKKCLLVGDTKQLPATVISQEAKKCHYDWSMMHRLFEECKQPHNMLNTQYRMHPEIRQWPSDKYYMSKLEDGANVLCYQPPKLLQEFPQLGPCTFFDISAKEKVSAHGSSYMNHNESEYVFRILKLMQERGKVDLAKQVGIITFYAGQVERIQNMLKNNRNFCNIQVSTVDGFQGDEKDFIIISFVRANYTGKIGFLTDFRRINVAITRARFALIMLGHIATLCKYRSDVSEMIENLNQRGFIHPEDDLMKILKPRQITVEQPPRIKKIEDKTLTLKITRASTNASATTIIDQNITAVTQTPKTQIENLPNSISTMNEVTQELTDEKLCVPGMLTIQRPEISKKTSGPTFANTLPKNMGLFAPNSQFFQLAHQIKTTKAYKAGLLRTPKMEFSLRKPQIITNTKIDNCAAKIPEKK